MEEALNYNAFLQGLIVAHARLDQEILDFGAGTGALARPLSACGYRITCVEPDGGLRAQLKASGLIAHPTLDAIPTRSLDLAYSVNVLEHISDDSGAIARLSDLLKPHGRLLIYVPAFPILFSSMDHKVGHMRRYRRNGLAQLLRQAGLTVDYIGYRDSLGFLATLMFK